MKKGNKLFLELLQEENEIILESLETIKNNDKIYFKSDLKLTNEYFIFDDFETFERNFCKKISNYEFVILKY